MIRTNEFTRSAMSIEPARDVRWKKIERRMEFRFIRLVVIVNVVEYLTSALGFGK